MPITGLSLTNVATYDIYDVTSSQRAQNATIDGETIIIRSSTGQIRPQQTQVDGTATISGSVTVDTTNNKLLILIDLEDEVEITLTTGSRTLTQIVADINAALTGTPVNQVSNRIRFNVDFRVDIRTIANDAYTLLGLTVGDTSNRILIKEAQIRIHNDVSTQLDHGSPLTYQYGNAGESGRSEQSRLEMVNSSITLEAHTSRRCVQFSTIRNSVIKEEGDNQETFVYTSIGCVLDDVVLFGIGQWELNGNPSVASDVTLDSCDAGPTNWQAGRLDLTGLDILNVRADGQHARLGNGNSGNNFFWFWNPTDNIDFGKMFRQNATCGAFRGYTYFPRFIDADGDIDGATLIYRDDRAATGTFVVRGTYTTGADGQLNGIHNSKDGTDETSSIDQDVLWLLTDLTVDNDPNGQYPEVTLVSGTRSYRQYDIQVVTPRLEFRSYGHLALTGYGEEDDFSISSPQGSINADGTGAQPTSIFVSIDEAVTESNRATVDAYSQLDNSAEAYDRLKSAWYADGDKGADGPYCTKSGSELDFGARDVTLSTTATDVVSVTAAGAVTLKTGTEFDGSLVTTGTVTVGSDIDVTGSIKDSTGVAVRVDGLPHGSDEHDDHFNHHGVVRFWPQSQGTDNRDNAITGEVADEEATSITVTLAADTAYYFVADALGFRRSPVQTLDTTNQTSTTVSLEAIVDAQGNELIPHELDTDETAQADLIEWGAEFIDVDADGVADEISYDAVVYAVEQGQSTAAACGSLLEPARIEVGRVVIPAGSNQKWRSKATLSNDDVSTAINNAAGYSAGDTDIVVDSVTGLTAGMTVVIAEGESDEEEAEIDSINTGTNTLTLTEGLTNAHTDNTTVTRDKSYPDLQSTGLFKDGAADQEDYIDFSNGPLKVKTEAPVFATVTGTRQTDFQGYLDNYANKDDWKAAASDVGSLDVTNDLNLIEALSIMLGVAVGRVAENSGDSSMLDIYSAVDDQLVITVPKFVGSARASGATLP